MGALTDDDIYNKVDRALRRSRSGYVYFLRCGEFVKIGYSETPLDRVAAIAAGSIGDHKLLGLVRGGITMEKQLHQRFKAFRHKGEWFHACSWVLSEIDKLVKADEMFIPIKLRRHYPPAER